MISCGNKVFRVVLGKSFDNKFFSSNDILRVLTEILTEKVEIIQTSFEIMGVAAVSMKI